MAWALSAFAQQTVEGIRKEYQAVHEMIAQMMPSGDDVPKRASWLRMRAVTG